MVRLFLSGDVMLARGIDQILEDPCDPELHEPYVRDARDYVALAEDASGAVPRGAPPAYPWGDALALLDAVRPDLRIVNLETSITRSDAWDRGKRIHYRTSPENARCLVAAKIDACTLANNHTLDWGVAGLLETLETLDALGVARCGAGRDLDEATAPAVLAAGDRRVAVFSVGCADAGVPPWWSATADRPGLFVLPELDEDAAHRLRRAILPWRDPATTIVASIHWGPNWGFEIAPAHRRFAHFLIDEAGVDVVHGHSSHHVKGIEVHAGRVILYGCGDLVTDYEGIRGHEAYRGELGLLYLVTLDGALAELEMIPTRMHRLRLARPAADDVRWLAGVLGRAGETLGTSVALEGDRLRLGW